MIQRTFIPGSKWIYLKIYTGIKTADIVLIKDINKIVKILINEKILTKWFFIRYNDPDPHLRVRFLINEESNVGYAINLLYKQFSKKAENGLIYKIQLDTYARELERYGHELIEEAETFFYLDSECILQIIKKLIVFNNENYRWMIALKLIDSFLSDFLGDVSQKYRLIQSMNRSFKAEFGFDQYNAKQFNKKYRDNKQIIGHILNNTIQDRNFNLLYIPITNRSKKTRFLVDKLIRQKKINIEFLLPSYVHMTIDRLFISKNRVHELVLYDFLSRFYESELARKKYNSPIFH